MDLVLVRHGAAEDRESFAASGRPDAERPLTERGRRKLDGTARGLRALVPRLERIATSPLVRARQTAAILAESYAGPEPLAIRELAPGASRTSLLRWLRRQPREGALVLVGHEPDLGDLARWLCGSEEPVALEKGGACLVRVPGDLGAGRAALIWQKKAAELGSA